ncbi:peptide deformylase [Streptomyces sp. NEAU-L66]|uniref:peptide deformylase n=1 Tax=Streptomyces sp. NEAU-L66 TaxID=3390812 RepID=UPI0039C6BC33
MRDLGVVQLGAPILAEPGRAFDLPVERDEAERVVDELFAAMRRIGQVHPFAKGMGLAAPQIGIARAAAVEPEPCAGRGIHSSSDGSPLRAAQVSSGAPHPLAPPVRLGGTPS